jgi:YVTN family beta-propeller protein
MASKFLAAFLLIGLAVASAELSPSAVVPSPDGKTLYIACATASRVLVFDVASGKVTRSVKVLPNPSGLCLSADGKRLFVTCASTESRVCVVDAKIVEQLPAGHTAMSPVLSPDGKTLFVCNRFNNDVSVLDLTTRTEIRRIPVRHEPVAAAITPDGKWLLVANHLPAGRADAEHVAAVVSVIDTERGAVVNDLWLPSGSGSLNDLRVSPVSNLDENVPCLTAVRMSPHVSRASVRARHSHPR